MLLCCPVHCEARVLFLARESRACLPRGGSPRVRGTRFRLRVWGGEPAVPGGDEAVFVGSRSSALLKASREGRGTSPPDPELLRKGLEWNRWESADICGFMRFQKKKKVVDSTAVTPNQRNVWSVSQESEKPSQPALASVGGRPQAGR